MDNQDPDSEWPPISLTDYYNSAGFYRNLAVWERRLERKYQNIDSHSIIYDSAADLLVKEVENHLIYARYMAKYPTEDDFLGYLYETCCHKVIDAARSFQRKFRQLDDEENIPDNGPSPEQQAIETEEGERRTRLVEDLKAHGIKTLSKMDRVILKHRVAGETLQEIADKLDIGVTTVHRRYRSIIRKLACELQNREANPKLKPMP